MCAWAVDATRFAAQLRPSKDMSVEELDQLLTTVDGYVVDHPPPVSTELVGGMLDACVKLKNDRLLQQCTAANDKCQEALQLIHTRRVSMLSSYFTYTVKSTTIQRRFPKQIQRHAVFTFGLSHRLSFHRPSKGYVDISTESPRARASDYSGVCKFPLSFKLSNNDVRSPHPYHLCIQCPTNYSEPCVTVCNYENLK